MFPLTPLALALVGLVAASQSESGQHLGEMIQRTARVIEALLGNTECGQLFVQRGGVASMLLLYELPRLVPSFGSHSPLHAVTSALRILAQHHAKQLAKLLAAALDSRLKVMDIEARVAPLSPFTANHEIQALMDRIAVQKSAIVQPLTRNPTPSHAHSILSPSLLHCLTLVAAKHNKKLTPLTKPPRSWNTPVQAPHCMKWCRESRSACVSY
jgi:hypothetical protein